MPTYQVTDPSTGRKVRLTGDSPPTEQELEEIFSSLPPIRPQQAEPKEDRGLMDEIAGGLETAGTMLSGAIAEPAAGVAGLATGALTGDPAAASAVVGGVRERMTYQPKTEEGQRNLQVMGEILEPVAKGFGATEDFLGETTLEATGSPALAAAAHSIPTAALEAVGVGVVKGAPKATASFAKQSPVKQRIAKLISEGSSDIDTAKYKLIDKSAPEKKVVKDKVAIEAINQGFDEGVIAAVKQSSPIDKKKMKQMAVVAEKAKKNARYGALNRPSDVVGDSLLNRYRVVRAENRRAGKKLDSVANSLKGKDVDVSAEVSSFLDDLADMGVNFDESMTPIFRGSDIEGIGPAERIVTNIVNRMKNTDVPSAYDVHRLKRFIDENVTYGKQGEGLTGQTESVLKRLRRNLDQRLDSQFPEYNNVNSTYAETINALDIFQETAGKKVNLTGKNADKAMGTVLRRALSNTQSRVNLLDSIDEIERVAKKAVSSRFPVRMRDVDAVKSRILDDDIVMQLLFADELDSVFGPAARTSLQGQVDQSIRRGARAASSETGVVDMAIEGVAKAAEKFRGINQANAFKSIRELLDE